MLAIDTNQLNRSKNTHTFEVARAFVDQHMTELTGSACKVMILLYLRASLDPDEYASLSHPEIRQMTGIKSRDTCRLALNELIALDLIKMVVSGHSRANTYAVKEDKEKTK